MTQFFTKLGNRLHRSGRSRRALSAVAIAAIVLTGCSMPVSEEKIAAADYGPRPPANYRTIIRSEIGEMLIDPTSPIFEFDTPRRGYTKTSPMFGTQETFGWRVCGTVNSKNRYGGYVGKVPYFVLFKDGQIVELLVGKITDNPYGLNLSNSAIVGACDRAVG